MSIINGLPTLAYTYQINMLGPFLAEVVSKFEEKEYIYTVIHCRDFKQYSGFNNHKEKCYKWTDAIDYGVCAIVQKRFENPIFTRSFNYDKDKNISVKEKIYLIN